MAAEENGLGKLSRFRRPELQLKLCPGAEPDETHGLAVLDWQQGRIAEARAGYERALALARQLGDPSAERDETHGLAVLDHDAENYDQAEEGFERALVLARQLGDPSAEAAELRNLGNLMHSRGQGERGRPMILESLAISERLSDPYNMGVCRRYLAAFDEEAGNKPSAIVHYREAVRRFE